MNEFGELRRIVKDDLELMRAWRNAPEISSKMYTRHEISVEEHQAWWSRTQDREDKAYFMYEDAGEPLGVVGFTEIDRTNQNCFWAFYASPGAPRGTGSRMELLALEHVFRTLYLKKLSCEVLAFNESVIRLHKKFGFQKEGVFRMHHKIDDAYVDVVRLALLSHDWAAARESALAKLSNR
ncbi:UDP-4-amino-4,6-dideoxy-N-acetyl-beta-L-altrosamine N-acetyltransferase [Hyphomonadaceae bacterium BL14]|nr:UDP-4-amino-4,6-dideoxy-N-acetyl-beta-L-altrosamine N-acetyltransferase [Hyphomonadaceae bacterium BL14]